MCRDECKFQIFHRSGDVETYTATTAIQQLFHRVEYLEEVVAGLRQKALELVDTQCVVCRGLGFVEKDFDVKRCAACDGSGGVSKKA